MISIQTNVPSLLAQENLRVTSEFQSKTIQRLTSGFRINQSGDDAAGLSVANKFRSDVAELMQGVRNANDGISTLQIIDGGMNNVSKMLDRLKTLASQSASATFTGDRNVVNSEFQNLLAEIDRQAQAIGLDQNGLYATTLSVFLGGGRTHATGAVSTDNGTVSIDLRSSVVDTKNLGLNGMVAVAGTADIGTGSATHTVAQILADAANTTVTGGYTDLYFAGPGFSDNSKVKVSVNLAGVTDIDTLVTNINAAISSAAGGTSQAAAAFGTAGIVAAAHTDATGGQQVSFSSSNSAFQVAAGDRMANALMGNFSAGTTGAALTSTVAGAASTAGAFVPTGVTVRLTGAGLTSPVDFTFDAGSTTTALAITDLTAQVAANATMQAAGITFGGTAGGVLTFTSARGEKFGVAVTGDTANRLGFGSFVAGAGSAVDYTTIAGSAAYTNTVSSGAAHLEFSINGAASSANVVDVNLALGDATAGAKTGTVVGPFADQTGLTILIGVDGGADQTVTYGATTTVALVAAEINAHTTGCIASVDGDGYLKITSDTKGANSDINITAGTGVLATIGLTAGHNYGASRTAADLVTAINAQLATNATLQRAGLTATQAGGTVTLASSNGTYFRVNAGTSGALANIGFGVAGAVYAGATVSASTQHSVDSEGASNAAGTDGLSAIAYSALAYGNDDQAITFSANDGAGVMQTKTITLHNDAVAARNGRSIDETLSYINTQLQQSNNATLQKIVAVKEDVAGVEKINFVSALTSFSVSVGSAGNGVNSGTAESVDSDILGTGSNISVDTKAAALQAVTAISTAIGNLGVAQAGVGRGQNALSWAMGLAQSQISSFSAAESRIRDADIAAEAANLTKAQVLQQAAIAAMAQANSAPQAVLALLRA